MADTASPWQVLLISGPAGAGKTAVARYFADTQTAPALHLSLDDIRCSVRAGFILPSLGWNDGTQFQYELACRACAAVARIYVNAGFRCVIDDAIFPEWDRVNMDGWQRELEGLNYRLVVLMPSLESALQRNAECNGDRRLSDELVRVIYDMMLPWQTSATLLIDNTSLTAQETAKRLAALLDPAVRPA
jgi:chloramphenicol 3-O-phosphotransferase